MKEHPQMVQVEFSNTAAAAKKVAEDGDKTQAAIAARRAAKEYGLEVLQESIQQEKNNCTRFIVIGKSRFICRKVIRSHFVLRCRMNVVPFIESCHIFYLTDSICFNWSHVQ